MRIAVVSDIHGNLTALEAVIADLRDASPDIILHGGDLADGGAHPVEVVDRIMDLGWPGILGNTDEMLVEPQSLNDFARGSSAPKPLFDAIAEMADWTRDRLGAERLGWLAALPPRRDQGPIALLHGSPGDCWRAPGPEAGDAELEALYGALGQPIVVYGHIHHPYVRRLARLTVANSGSVGLPYDGDPRASYLLIDGDMVTIRRVDYDIEREVGTLAASGLPHAGWTAAMLREARPLLP